MTPEELKSFCNLLMASDPWPIDGEEDKIILENFADNEAKRQGFKDWIGAFHKEGEIK